MNLSPAWRVVLNIAGHTVTHWSDVGDPRAKDCDIMYWARVNGYVIFTHDLDFSAILASTKATGPSVIQIRGQDVLPNKAGNLVLRSLAQFAKELQHGAIVVVEDDRIRARVLPLP